MMAEVVVAKRKLAKKTSSGFATPSKDDDLLGHSPNADEQRLDNENADSALLALPPDKGEKTVKKSSKDGQAVTRSTKNPSKSTPSTSSKDMNKMADAMADMAKTIQELKAEMAQRSQPVPMVSYDTPEYDEYYEDNDYDDYEEENVSNANDEGLTGATNKRPAEENEPSLTGKKKKVLEKMKEAASSIEVKGPKINNELAENITVFMRTRPDETKLKSMFETLNPPENCPGLQSVTVNESIWSRISYEARSVDVRMQRAHNALVKGVTAVARVVDSLLEKWDADTGVLQESDYDDIMDKSTSAFKAFGAANFELCMRRRENMKATILSDYVHLCAPSVPYTNKLFGDDVTKVIKDISDDNRVNRRPFMKRGGNSSRAGRRGGNNYGQHYNNYRGQSRGRRGRGGNYFSHQPQYAPQRGGRSRTATQTQAQPSSSQ